MRHRRWNATIGLVFLTTALTACTAGTSDPGPSTDTAPSDVGASASSAGDAGVAQLCGAVSIITMNLHNAATDFNAGVITREQHVAIINASALDYQGLTFIAPQGEALFSQVADVNGAIKRATPTEDGALFQPERTDLVGDNSYLGTSSALRDACEAAGFPNSMLGGASSGG